MYKRVISGVVGSFLLLLIFVASIIAEAESDKPPWLVVLILGFALSGFVLLAIAIAPRRTRVRFSVADLGKDFGKELFERIVVGFFKGMLNLFGQLLTRIF